MSELLETDEKPVKVAVKVEKYHHLHLEKDLIGETNSKQTHQKRKVH